MKKVKVENAVGKCLAHDIIRYGPACVISDKRTSFDLLLPRVLAKEKITKAELAELGHGGLL